MKQVGVDLCNLPEVDGFKHLIVLIEVSNKLIEITSTEQRVTSAYHPQSYGLCERQNRTIEDSLAKILEKNPKEWPNVIQGVLFAHRVSVHYSTKFSPFFLLYNRHPTLSIDIKYNLVKESYDKTVDEPYDYETFRAVLNSSSKIREVTHDKASQNIKKAQEKQNTTQHTATKHTTINITHWIKGTLTKSQTTGQERREVYIQMDRSLHHRISLENWLMCPN